MSRDADGPGNSRVVPSLDDHSPNKKNCREDMESAQISRGFRG